MLQHGLFVTRGTQDLSPERERSMVLLSYESKQKVCQPIQLYRVLPFTAVFYAEANLGNTSVKFRHAASLPRRERGVNLRIGRGKTSVNG